MNSNTKISWLIPGRLAKSSIPDYTDLIVWKEEAGIDSVVNLLEDWYQEIVRDEKETGFNVLHAPIRDFYGPSVEQLHTIVQWIDQEITHDRKVLVHCYAGIGRTSVILIAYLIYKGHKISRAADEVLHVGAAPQSFEQKEILEQYCLFLQKQEHKS